MKPPCSSCGIALLEESSSGLCVICESSTGQPNHPRKISIASAHESVATTCRTCGRPLAGAFFAGMCPTCLLIQQKSGSPGMDSSSAPVIPGYRFIDLFGRGGMGVVWRAEQIAMKRTVAVKLCPSGRGLNAEAVLRFKQEIVVTARLKHPNIAQVFDAGETGRLAYYVMEYIEGQNLDIYARSRRLGLRKCVELMKIVADAVQHAHQNGIIHRDLKPSNILVTAAGEPKVVDFGLAKILRQEGADIMGLSQSRQMLGTVPYMPPEVLQESVLDTRADVYALGIILFELLTGEHPYGRIETPEAFFLRLAHEEPRRPRSLRPDLDPELEMLLLKTLSKSPDERYRTAGELADDLGRWLREEPLTAGRATPLYFARKWLRRHRIRAAVALGVTLAAIGGAAAYIVNIRAEREQTNRLYAETLAQNAELAIQRGEWKLAQHQLSEAIRANHPAGLDLRVRRLDVYDGLNQAAARDEEILALASLPLSPVNRARIELRRGESLCYEGHATEGNGVIEATVKTGQLPDHEKAYAQGLLAETSADALIHFRKALELSPYTYRYHQMMWLMLATLGYLQEEEKQLDASAILFPNDANLIAMRAILEAHCGRDERARELLDSLAPVMSSADREILQTVCEIDWAFRYYLVESWDGMAPDLPSQKYPALLIKLIFISQNPLATAAARFKMQTPSFLERSLGNLSKALIKWKLGDWNGAMETLAEAEKSHREATCFFIKGLLLAVQYPVGTKAKPESFADFRERLRQAVEAFDEAGRLPSIFAGIPETADLGAAFAEMTLGSHAQISPEERGKIRVRILSRYKKAARAEPLRPFHATKAAQIALILKDYEFARQAASFLPEDQPARHKLLIEVALQSGNLSEALSLADASALRFPANAEFSKLREQAGEDLPRVVEGLEKTLEILRPNWQTFSR